ncbi:MAG: hypothetical protein COW29_07620 [Rhodobacterales bacterium CG15_BIG_FIL_POST_REV_8_21_14_020_59_13]|nr:outer membrane beta-barrel protein [Sphingomonadales bacterium]NCP26025.1 outer membrane beta-barrel protein [Sphingomonadales bacterium]NCP48621.1 outer membrane beta-barrel protein [Sphingomonadales bacterium]NCQ20178.1 outer membrane beta-barrel protein [Sphingomonadales bacterium]PIW29021.1 MAG: hypothetical protein COW29_07620 [Rhodobacterales bacterium CG15_BIG_FIL_POST_REV_8_21_14_020_59_13]
MGMYPKRIFGSLVMLATLAAAGASQPVFAQVVQASGTEDNSPDEQNDPDSGFFGEAEIGLRYDSDVAVDELDLTSRSADEALRLRARLGYETEIGSETELKLAYGVSQIWYEDFSSFDLQTHTLSAAVSHDLGPARAGLAYRYVHARLDRDGFLDIHRVTPSISGFVAPGLYARAELLYRETDFLGRVDRDSSTYGGGLDVYLFLDGTNQYFSAGYDYADVDATDSQFDYAGHTARLGFAQKFPFGSDRGQLKLGWRYQSRDYAGVTPSIGQERQDDRHRLRAEVEIPIARRLSLSSRYTFSDYSSNLPTVDYSQSVVDLTLSAEF